MSGEKQVITHLRGDADVRVARVDGDRVDRFGANRERPPRGIAWMAFNVLVFYK